MIQKKTKLFIENLETHLGQLMDYYPDDRNSLDLEARLTKPCPVLIYEFEPALLDLEGFFVLFLLDGEKTYEMVLDYDRFNLWFKPHCLNQKKPKEE